MPQYTLEQLGNQVLSELDAWGRQDILVGGITSVATSFTCKDSSNYKKYSRIEIGAEIVIVATEASSTNVDITSGRGREGSTRKLTDHSAGSVIRVRPRVYREHINMLINDCLTGHLETRVEDESLTTVLNQVVYDLPSGIALDQVTEIAIMDNDGTDVEAVWKRVRFHKGTGTGGLDEFELLGAPIASRTIKIQHRKNFAALTSLSDILDETGIASTEQVQRLVLWYVLANLLPRKEGKRMMKDKNTFPDNSTPFGARHNDGQYYMDKFVEERGLAGLTPNRTGTQFITK